MFCLDFWNWVLCSLINVWYLNYRSTILPFKNGGNVRWMKAFILCFLVTSCLFQNLKSQSLWVLSFLRLLNILNTFRFEGFHLNSNLRFYSRAFWNSVFSRHRTSRRPKECDTNVWKKNAHSVILSNLNCWGIVKSVYVDMLCLKGRTDRFL